MPRMRKITTEEAIISTATVEVKTLTLNGRQVTLAVYRQLESDNVLNWDTGEMRGVPWGRVNYHVDCPKNDYDRVIDPHLHVVWQKGLELRRSEIERSWSFDSLREAAESAGRQTVILRSLQEQWKPGESELRADVAGRTMRLVTEGCRLDVFFWDELVGIWSRNDYLRDKAQKEILRVLGNTPADQPWQQHREQVLVPAVTKLVKAREAWSKNYAELEKLDQLFIAV